MKAVVVFESMFGNTERVAREIAAGLAEHGHVEVFNVDDMTSRFEPADLLVVGGPTHAFGLSRPATRKSATQQATGPLVTTGDGVREWLAGLEQGSGAAAAAFGTHANMARRVPGSAVRGVAKRLRGKGFRLVDKPENFFVEDITGPLTDGELERARAWGQQLGAAVMSSKSAGSR